MAVDGRDHQLGRVLQAKQRLIRVQAKIILERRIDAGQHLDVRPGGKELIPRSRQHDHVRVIVHTRFKNRLIELAVHLIGVGVGRRIGHFDHRHAAYRGGS